MSLSKADKVVEGIGGLGLMLALTLLVVFGVAQGARTTTTVAEGVANNASWITTAACTNGTACEATGYTYLSALTGCINASTGTTIDTTDNVSITYTGDDTNDGTLTRIDDDDGAMNCSLTYRAATTASNTVGTIGTQLSNATTWVNILIIVAFAAIVMMVYKKRKSM